MPFVNTFTSDGAGIHQVGTGVVTGAEILAATAAVANAPDKARTLRYSLVDLSDASVFRATPDDIRLISRQGATIALLAPDAAVAVVAPKDDAYGLARMWQTMVEMTGWQTAVFRERVLAMTWLRDRVPDLKI